MMKKLPYITYLLLVCLLLNNSLFAQETSQSSYYNWFDNLIGVENTGLFDGIQYKEQYRTINEKHKFYNSPRFLKGNLIYDEQPYYNIDMKYDLYEDVVLIRLDNPDGGDVILQLIKSKIKEFTINGNRFINLDYNTTITEVSLGFHEVLFQKNEIVFYKKNKKSKKDRLDQKILYSEFNDDSNYKLFYNNEFYDIKSKRNLIKIFPDLKKEINAFHDKNRSLLDSNPDAYMLQLMKSIQNNLP